MLFNPGQAGGPEYMKVLMLGWEFPPYISGGLGTACQGLTQGLSELGTDITFVLPQGVISNRPLKGNWDRLKGGFYKLESLPNVKFYPLPVEMYPYSNPQNVSAAVGAGESKVATSASSASSKTPANPISAIGAGHYGSDLFSQVQRFSDLACRVAQSDDFDVIHAHDWMTFPAATAIADIINKPLVVHVHSTERDRCGQNTNDRIYHIERMGMHRAARVIVVSRYTQQMCMDHYAVARDKFHVVYNAVNYEGIINWDRKQEDEKVVLFLGRITMQKGPEYFIAAAKKVLDMVDKVKFIMAGTGDMYHRMIDYAAQLGIGHKLLFTGFLRGDDVKRAFQMADLYVMPSVSEPFGIAPLEALSNDVPVIISKQSGVSEVLTHVLKVDFWDVDELANKIAAVLKYPALPKTLRQHANHELSKFDWTQSARKCLEAYNAAIRMAS